MVLQVEQLRGGWQGLSGSIAENGVVGLGVPGMEFGAAVEGFFLGISAEKGCY